MHNYTRMLLTGISGAPRDLGYTDMNARYTAGLTVVHNAPFNSGGAIQSYSISPALPTGLTLNPSSGVISGVAEEVHVAAVWTVEGINDAGAVSVNLTITLLQQTGGEALRQLQDKIISPDGASKNATFGPSSLSGLPYLVDFVSSATQQSRVQLHNVTTNSDNSSRNHGR